MMAKAPEMRGTALEARGKSPEGRGKALGKEEGPNLTRKAVVNLISISKQANWLYAATYMQTLCQSL